MQYRIDHFGEGIDDRAIIDAVKRQRNAERVQREQSVALARARAAARAAKLRANSARIEAQIAKGPDPALVQGSEEHTSELQSLMRISYAVFCLKKKNNINNRATRNMT